MHIVVMCVEIQSSDFDRVLFTCLETFCRCKLINSRVRNELEKFNLRGKFCNA